MATSGCTMAVVVEPSLQLQREPTGCCVLMGHLYMLWYCMIAMLDNNLDCLMPVILPLCSVVIQRDLLLVPEETCVRVELRHVQLQYVGLYCIIPVNQKQYE